VRTAQRLSHVSRHCAERSAGPARFQAAGLPRYAAAPLKEDSRARAWLSGGWHYDVESREQHILASIDADRSAIQRVLANEMMGRLKSEVLEERIRDIERQLATAAEPALLIRRLRTIPGIGVLTATALVAVVGDVQRFPSARHFASYLGLTPREHSSGQRRHLGAISKQGDIYLRMLFIHGARSVLHHAKSKTAPATDRLRTWALQVERLRGHNKAAVALANKLARIVWRSGGAGTTSPPCLWSDPPEGRAHPRLRGTRH
jgi:transposase